MFKSGLVVAALVFSTAGIACDDAARAGTMDGFRERALAQLRAENAEALRESLHRSQVMLSSQTRERFLAGQPEPGSSNGTSSARGAP